MNNIDIERGLISIVYRNLEDINFNVSLGMIKSSLTNIEWKLKDMKIAKSKKEYLTMSLSNISKLDNKITIENRIKQVLDIIQYWL